MIDSPPQQWPGHNYLLYSLCRLPIRTYPLICLSFIQLDFLEISIILRKEVLGAILEINPEDITDIEFRDTYLDKGHLDEKQGILDIRVTINHEKEINIELQISPFKYWKNRTMFYNFKMFVDQGHVGSKYKEFAPCIHISILDFILFPKSSKIHSKIQLLDIENHQLYTDKIAFHVVELEKVKYVTSDNKRQELYDLVQVN